jgi:3-oxoacyl-[acyl-carrier-protein] synthase-3
MGVDLALRTLSAGGAGTAALVTTGDRFALPGFDRWRSDYDVAYGDGATAVVLRTGSPRASELRVLGMATTAMPELEVMYRAGDAFSDAPLSHASPIDVRRPKRAWLASGGGAGLAEKGPRAVEEVLRCALQCAGLSPGHKKVRRIAVPRIGSRTIEQMYLPAVRRVLGRDIVQLGPPTGHLGAGDFLANISAFVTDELDEGEVALVIGGGGGFTLSCLVLRRH